MAKKESFVLVSLEEGKSKKLAQSIGNKTCRKILNFLADNDNATESHIAKELKIALSTVHYNLKQLKEAGLVDVDEFHYSKKGREVDHYTLANKYIVIAPRVTEKVMEKLKRILPVTTIALATAGLMKIFSNLYTKTISYTVPIATKASGAEVGDVSAKVTEGLRASITSSSDAAWNYGLEESASIVADTSTQNVTLVTKITEVPYFSNELIIWFLIGAGVVILAFFLFSLRKR
jgi:DNA-binding transcriptional ArsR family regulator